MNFKKERKSLRDNPEALEVLDRVRQCAIGDPVQPVMAIDGTVKHHVPAPVREQLQAADLYLRHVADAGPEAPEELPDHELAASVVARYMDDPRVMEAVARLRASKH